MSLSVARGNGVLPCANLASAQMLGWPLVFVLSRPMSSKRIIANDNEETAFKGIAPTHYHMCERQFQHVSCQCQCSSLCAESVCSLSCLTNHLRSCSRWDLPRDRLVVFSQSSEGILTWLAAKQVSAVIEPSKTHDLPQPVLQADGHFDVAYHHSPDAQWEQWHSLGAWRLVHNQATSSETTRPVSNYLRPCRSLPCKTDGRQVLVIVVAVAQQAVECAGHKSAYPA